MAVQAQYPPSNLLLLNRNAQDPLDYSSIQSHPGGFLDHSPLLFTNNGGANNNNPNSNQSRKRPRDHQFSLHHHQQAASSQLIDLSQLQSQPNVVSTGLRLSFGDQQIHHYHQHHQQQQQQQQTFVANSSSTILSLLSEDFASQIKRQREELDQYLLQQGEQLRRTLAEKRHRHYRALITAAEDSIGKRLREKEAEVEKAARRNAELEARATQLSVEAQVWQAKARAQEATAAALQAQLQQAIINGGGMAQDSRRGGGGDESSGGVEGQAEDAESAYVDPDRVNGSGGPGCRGCNKRAANVVVLPCRHLCLCTECDQVAQSCPLCLQLRNSSVEVFLY
ncbi:SBP (S-ribonuclease binding protein) family protein [Euphorbia peplus]|nr:SBP (S-ribonuclease binding protein) family protein [Euphorbia peplus]